MKIENIKFMSREEHSKITLLDGAYPVIHAHWIDTRLENSTGDIYECSACGELYNPEKKAIQLKRQSKNPDYCPNCGADMRKEEKK